MSTFIIKDYVVSRKRIGKGAFSTIYKAYNTNDSRQYAVKEVIIEKKSVKSNVKREFLVLKKLNHPNVVKLYDLIVDTNYNNIYFVFDYYSKGDFAKFLDNKPLKEKYCKKYSKQLADGLQYLLENNIIHRDLKPQNILVTDELDIKITDFGFARKFDKNVLFNTLCGSPMYMAPEIINKQDYSIKSDLWSVGVIIYQMFFGRVPFDVVNFVQLIKKINNEEINFSDTSISISNNAMSLIKSLLRVNVDERLDWKPFFYHSWFLVDDILIEENNLMDFSMNNKSTLPSLSNINHHLGEKQFASFRHASIKLKESSSLSKNASINQNEGEIYNHNSKTPDIEMTFLESIEDHDNDRQDESSNSEFNSCEEFTISSTGLKINNIIENNQTILENSTNIIENRKKEVSSSIEYEISDDRTHSYNTRYQARMKTQSSIYTKQNQKNEIQNDIKKTKVNTKFNISSSSLFKSDYSDIINCENLNYKPSDPISIPATYGSGRAIFDMDNSISDYILVNNNDKNLNINISNNSEPIKNISRVISDSFREYLNSSVTMIKHSYNYITNNKSI